MPLREASGRWWAISTSISYSIPTYRCPDERLQTSDGGAAATYCGANECGYGNYVADYLVFGSPTTNSLEGSATFASIRDGASNTLFLAEHYGTCASGGNLTDSFALASLWSDANMPWTPRFCYNWDSTARAYKCSLFQVAPDPLSECDNTRAQTLHTGGMNVGVGDGSVRCISATIDLKLWQNLCDPRDGAVVGSDW